MAASAAAIEIRDIFDEIISNNLRYCALCLRTENERKLVDPKSFMKCLCIMRLRVPVVNTICFVCEAAAARAVTLFQAISFSCLINRWFKDMSTRLKYKDEMPAHLDKYMESHSKQSVGPGAPLPIGEAWRLARSHHELVQTEVLLVSDELPNETDLEVIEMIRGSPTLDPPSSPAADPTPPPHSPSPIEKIEFNNSAPVLESVVIIDDDEDFTKVEVSLAPEPAPLEPGEMQLYARDGSDSSFLLHPIVSGADGALYVPSLRGRLRGARLEPADLPADSQLILPSPTEVVNEGVLIPASECDPLANTQGVPEFLGTRDMRDMRDTRDTQETLEFVPAMSRVYSPPLSHVPPPSPPGANARAARPLAGGRIDWEDKIPMDVISFMDATDPFADQILKGPEDRPPKRPHREEDDVIDLC